MIKVILRADVVGLGRQGEVRQVKDGYARNFLLARNLAFVATDEAVRQIQEQQKKDEVRRVQDKKKAEELAGKLTNISVTVAVEVNEEEKLYGALSAQDIEKALLAEGVEIDKKNIVLEAPIKELGIYDIPIKLQPEVAAKIKVWVVKK